MRKLSYVARVSIFLVVVALIVGFVGCAQVPSPLGSPEYPIVHLACGEQHTVGVKIDGTIVAVGSDYYHQCSVDSWTNIIGVAAGYFHTVGLKADGTAIAAGYNIYNQRDVHSWRDIVQVAAGSSHTVGVKADGTVVACRRLDGHHPGRRRQLAHSRGQVRWHCGRHGI